MRMIIIALRSGRPLRKARKHDIAHIASSITLASRVLAFLLFFFSLHPKTLLRRFDGVSVCSVFGFSRGIRDKPHHVALSAAAGSSSAWRKNAALVNGQRAVGQRAGDLTVLIDFNRLAAALAEDAAVDNQLAAGDISRPGLRP